MKKISIALFLIFTAFAKICSGQSVSKIDNHKLVYLLNSTEKFVKANNVGLTVNIFQVSNPSGSAHILGTDEVTCKFYIATSTIDELPEQHVFALGNFYAPKIISLTNVGKQSFLLKIKYFKRKHHQIGKYLITLSKIKII